MANEKNTQTNKISFSIGGSSLSIIKYDDGRGAVFFTKGETKKRKNLSIWGTGSALEQILSKDIVTMFMTKVSDLGKIFESIPGEAFDVEEKRKV